MPVWQQFVKEHQQQLAFISVAMDAQGSDAPRPYAEPTHETFPTLIDEDNLLGDTFGFKAIPNGILISADGLLDGTVAGRFDIRRSETRELVEGWLAGGEPLPAAVDEHDWSPEALQLFREAGAAIRRDERGHAIALLKRAFPLEPDNLIIRKQLWAIEHPERFYRGEVDYAWQREQLEAGR